MIIVTSKLKTQNSSKPLSFLEGQQREGACKWRPWTVSGPGHQSQSRNQVAFTESGGGETPDSRPPEPGIEGTGSSDHHKIIRPPSALISLIN